MDFPAPFGPTTPSTRPAGRLSVTGWRITGPRGARQDAPARVRLAALTGAIPRPVRPQKSRPERAQAWCGEACPGVGWTSTNRHQGWHSARQSGPGRQYRQPDRYRQTGRWPCRSPDRQPCRAGRNPPCRPHPKSRTARLSPGRPCSSHRANVQAVRTRDGNRCRCGGTRCRRLCDGRLALWLSVWSALRAPHESAGAKAMIDFAMPGIPVAHDNSPFPDTPPGLSYDGHGRSPDLRVTAHSNLPGTIFAPVVNLEEARRSQLRGQSRIQRLLATPHRVPF
ncbi:hypothetical protein HOE425_331348 [Hoeflea sp. EC-HK425]|nr:hypothetical protein HOE425_331348 [Hoeflea sp. EC-HK425]